MLSVYAEHIGRFIGNFALSEPSNQKSDEAVLFRHCTNPEEADWVWVNRNSLMSAASCRKIKLNVQVQEHLLTFEADLESEVSLPPLLTDLRP